MIFSFFGFRSSIFHIWSSNNINHMNHIISFGPKLFATKTTKFQQTYKPSTPPSSVSGLLSSNNMNHMNHIISFGPKLFATKTQKHQISPNIQTFNSSFFRLQSPVSGLRSSVFQQHEQNKPHEPYNFVQA